MRRMGWGAGGGWEEPEGGVDASFPGRRVWWQSVVFCWSMLLYKLMWLPNNGVGI
ncbi:hypothetical protein TSUD_238440 [Trifolium subterraneum]|uniref:Uncharacterized protein n=1 Tax=Trifolium subterraneum TaxID=3900 RepID=A0A2Z6PA87_TRISU|nr:hypothetical protein TSUD_238440 [Trifolium subterraneum]